MINWIKSNIFEDWITKCAISTQKYGNYIKENTKQLVLSLYIEETTDKFIALLDDSIGVDWDLIDEENLAILDSIIGEGFSNTPDKEIDETELQTLIENFGSYLGSNIIHNLGGEWRFREELLHCSIYFGSKDIECFPFHRVSKRVLNGPLFSLDKFYEEILIKLDVIDS